MRPQFRRLVASILLGAFSVFLIPTEFVHALYRHADTKEIISVDGKNNVGAHHIHCNFLTYEASQFISSSFQNFPVVTENSFSFTVVANGQSGIYFSQFISLRGPPLV